MSFELNPEEKRILLGVWFGVVFVLGAIVGILIS